MRLTKIRIVLLLLAIAVAGVSIRETSYHHRECYDKFDREKNLTGLVKQYRERLKNETRLSLTFEISNISKPYRGASGYEYRNQDGSLYGVASGDGCGVLDVNPGQNDAGYLPVG